MTASYRPEVDGLRAIAVSSVVLYHAEILLPGFNVASGGYLGVDVFFVISGYLISRIILTEIKETGRLSLLGFYDRRIRRIIPALLFVLTCSTVAAWHVLLQTPLKEYFGSVLASLFFVANFYFWDVTTAYGAPDSLLKPLLHMWTLSVEEQFYILFPWLALLLFPRFWRHAAWIMLSLLAVSLLVAQSQSRSSPALSFYMLHTRAWELIAGIVLSLLEMRHGRVAPPALKNVLPALGLAMIMCSMALFGDETVHPGFMTLVPVVGTCLIVYFGGGSDPVTRFLSVKPIVSIGLVSYSLYLWHFPVLALARNVLLDFTMALKLVAVCVAILLSILSYFVVERPLRNRKIVPGKVFYPFIACWVILLLGSSVYVLANPGVTGHPAASTSGLLEYQPDNEFLKDESWTILRDLEAGFASDEQLKILVIGNSHSKDVFNLLYLHKQDYPGVQFRRKGIELGCFQTGHRLAEEFLGSGPYQEADGILISTRYMEKRYCDEEDESEERVSDMEGLRVAIRKMRDDGKVVAVTSNTVEFEKISSTVTLFDRGYRAMKFESKADVERFIEQTNKQYFARRYLNRERIPEIDASVERIAKSEGAVYLDKRPLICDEDARMCFGATPEGRKSFYDYGHLTLDGARYFGERAVETGWLDPFLSRLRSDPINE